MYAIQEDCEAGMKAECLHAFLNIKVFLRILVNFIFIHDRFGKKRAHFA